MVPSGATCQLANRTRPGSTSAAPYSPGGRGDGAAVREAARFAGASGEVPRQAASSVAASSRSLVAAVNRDMCSIASTLLPPPFFCDAVLSRPPPAGPHLITGKPNKQRCVMKVRTKVKAGSGRGYWQELIETIVW
jgi:hypothetical protein